MRPGSPTTTPSARSSARSDGLSLDYYGFDTTRPPFDDVRRSPGVRPGRRLAAARRPGAAATPIPATGMVPPGIPGRSDADFLPAHDPAGARERCSPRPAIPGGAGFPAAILLGGVSDEDRASRRRSSGSSASTSSVEIQGDGLLRPPRRTTRPRSSRWAGSPTIPGPNDFLGHPPRDRRLEQLRPLVIGAIRRGDRRGARAPRSGRGPGRVRPRRGDRPRRGAGDPADLRRRAGRLPGTACSGPTQNGLGIVRDGGPRVGPLIDDAESRVRAASLAARRAPDRERARRVRRGSGDVRAADARPRSSATASSSSSRLRSTRIDPSGSRSSSRPRARSGRSSGSSQTAPTSGDPTLRFRPRPRRTGTPSRTRRITARWRLVGTDGTKGVGPAVTVTYDDDRFDWKTLERVGRPGPLVRRQPGLRRACPEDRRRRRRRDGEAARGDRERTARLLHLRRPGRVLRRPRPGDAGERRRPGAARHPDAVRADHAEPRSTTRWVEIVVPHELTHVVFADRGRQPLPRSAALAQRGPGRLRSAGYADDDRQQVEAAARDGTIIPLDGLAGAFPTSAIASSWPTPRASRPSTASCASTVATPWSG